MSDALLGDRGEAVPYHVVQRWGLTALNWVWAPCSGGLELGVGMQRWP